MPQKTYPPIAVIGLDCAPPELVFDAWLEDLPNLRALTRRGLYGKLESTIPPITVPAWMCMMTSRDPGTLGIYGFRNRKDHSYTGLGFASSLMVKEPTVYDLLGEEGARVITLGVPLTWPPKPVNGLMVSGFPIPP
ncbi:MAG TPA: alkaline phosphatase family protein, partial [Armatimonadota bacterium]